MLSLETKARIMAYTVPTSAIYTEVVQELNDLTNEHTEPYTSRLKGVLASYVKDPLDCEYTGNAIGRCLFKIFIDGDPVDWSVRELETFRIGERYETTELLRRCEIRSTLLNGELTRINDLMKNLQGKVLKEMPSAQWSNADDNVEIESNNLRELNALGDEKALVSRALEFVRETLETIYLWKAEQSEDVQQIFMNRERHMTWSFINGYHDLMLKLKEI